MRPSLCSLLVLPLALCAALFGLAGKAGARPIDASRLPRFHQIDAGGPSAATPRETASLSGGGAYVYFDTATYGGTVWAPDSNRWEALRGTGASSRCWTFDTGVGSNFTEPISAPKPAGYHHRMEGWTGIDNTFDTRRYFRLTGPAAPQVPDVSVPSTCTIAGNWSLWAGVTLAEAEALCYAAGQGYGTNWNLTMARTFAYPGTGSVTLGYAYAVEAEPSFDYLFVEIDTTGNGSQDDVCITLYDGIVSGSASHTLIPGATMRSSAGSVVIKFRASSDGAYDDQDGSYVTNCGHSIVDNITLSGAISSNSNFEDGTLQGWAPVLPTSGPGGEWSHLRHLSNLPPPLSFCRCSVADSVLLFAEPSGGHNWRVDNIVASPWCDLRANGDAGKPGKLIIYTGYFEPMSPNYLFVQHLASWYPSICPQTGKVYTHPFVSNGLYYNYGGVPTCGASNAPNIINFSSVIEPGAEQVRIAVGIVTYCDFYQCPPPSTSTPWFDNVALGVYGTPGAPIVSLRTIDVFQDNFSRDGTLDPVSPGRVDINTVKGAGRPAPRTALGDTLVIFGDGGNQEVRVVFRVRPGPFTNLANLNAWAAAKWTNAGVAAPGYFGGTFWEARCDTAEQGGAVTTPRRWMSTLHELDPKFGGGTDRDRGAEGDGSQLSHDIFPDNILTPGSRIDYFVKARYLPPDPRNPSGTSHFITPDTTSGRFLEIEILPSSMAADTTWNCVLHVDHRADRDFLAQQIVEQGLTGHLGAGGNNAEGTKFDRYDVEAPSSQQASLGRPLNTQYGASTTQMFFYRAISWQSGNLVSFNLVDEDANNLSAWLTFADIDGNRFYGAGDGLVRSMSSEGEPTTINFLSNVLGVRLGCDTIRLASCPAGSTLDSTFCLPLANVAGSEFATTIATNARGNGCPNLRSFDVIQPNTSVPTAKGQLTYVKSSSALAPPNFMSVTNHNTVDVDYKTVLDGVETGYLRDPNGNTHAFLRCDITTPSLTRVDDVFDWFQAPTTFGICRVPTAISGAVDDPIGGNRPLVSALRPPIPNPMSPGTRIAFTNGVPNGPVRLQLFDVTGRLVRTLVDTTLPGGVHEVVWDGTDEAGARVANGLYFVRLATKDALRSQKLIVSR